MAIMGERSQRPGDLDIKNCEDRIPDLSWSTSQVSARMDLTTREQVMEHANSSVEVHAIMKSEPTDGVISRSVALSANAQSVAELTLGLFAAARRCNGRRCSCQYSAVSVR